MPTLDALSTKKLLKGIYTPNEPDTENDIKTNVTDFIIESGNYKNQRIKLYEIFNRSVSPRI